MNVLRRCNRSTSPFILSTSTNGGHRPSAKNKAVSPPHSVFLGVTWNILGSTAVPGLLAKPVIDIIHGSEGWPPDNVLIEAINRAGYEFLGEAGLPERLYFRLRGTTRFNLHVVRLDGHRWCANLALRDSLRGNEVARSSMRKQNSPRSQRATQLCLRIPRRNPP